MSKITLNTITSFVRKNQGNIYIRNISDYDGMQDGVRNCNNQGWRLAGPAKHSNEKGIGGAWFVGGDMLQTVNADGFTGYDVYNCCGHFQIAVKQQLKPA